jgi:positive regulator of sigma E activity
METIYDWTSIAIFAAIIVLFLQRSVEDSPVQDSLLSYFPPAIGCAVANQLGNHAIKEDGGMTFHALAIATMAAVLAYCWFVLKPFAKHPKD